MLDIASIDARARKIHDAGIHILETLGISIEDPTVVDLMLERGCKKSSERLLIPGDVINEVLSFTQTSFDLYDRRGNSFCRVGGEKLLCQPVGCTPFVVDQETSANRLAVRKDLQNLTTLIDQLDYMHVVTVTATPTDVDEKLQSYIGLADTLMFSKKPVSISGPNTDAEFLNMLRLAEIICGTSDFSTKPQMLVSILPVSPLRIPRGLGEVIIQTAKRGIPISIVPLPVTGVSCPLSLSGALAQQHAENLSIICIARMVNPEQPLVYHGRLSVGDMRSGASIWGVLDVGLAGAWATVLGKLCNLPVNVYGFSTSAKYPDIQSGAERLLNAWLPVQSGANILGGAGSLADILAVSPAQLVIDNELMSWIYHIQDLMDIDELDIPFDTIRSVAQDPQGSFMLEMNTVRSLKKKRQWLGELVDRSSFDMFEKRGRPTMLQLANNKVSSILENSHNNDLLDPVIVREVDHLLQTIKDELPA